MMNDKTKHFEIESCETCLICISTYSIHFHCFLIQLSSDTNWVFIDTTFALKRINAGLQFFDLNAINAINLT